MIIMGLMRFISEVLVAKRYTKCELLNYPIKTPPPGGDDTKRRQFLSHQEDLIKREIYLHYYEYVNEDENNCALALVVDWAGNCQTNNGNGQLPINPSTEIQQCIDIDALPKASRIVKEPALISEVEPMLSHSRYSSESSASLKSFESSDTRPSMANCEITECTECALADDQIVYVEHEEAQSRQEEFEEDEYNEKYVGGYTEPESECTDKDNLVYERDTKHEPPDVEAASANQDDGFQHPSDEQ
jgi:hypothetical protein